MYYSLPAPQRLFEHFGLLIKKRDVLKGFCHLKTITRWNMEAVRTRNGNDIAKKTL